MMGVALAASLGVAGLACSLGVPRSSIAPQVAFAGCYEVVIGPWARTGGAMGLVPPERFRLDTALVRDTLPMPARYQLDSPAPPSRSPDAQAPSWRVRPPDSISVVWFNGFSLGSLHLRIVGDSVTGVAHTRSDVRTGLPDPTAPVTGRRVRCGDVPTPG